MMVKKDLHIHTVFCDGNNTPEEMVRSAIDMGLECIGFSAHSYTYFDTSYAMTEDDTPKYIAEIKRLKGLFSGQIEILCGIEQDYYADSPLYDYDYIIGSVHYVLAGKKYIPVDETKDLLARAGYALSPCDKTDIIFSYFIENEIYDMIELDIQLEEYGLPCIIA